MNMLRNFSSYFAPSVKTVADDGEVPAFVVFSNKTLEAMATYFPQTEEELQEIYGISSAKVEKLR